MSKKIVIIGAGEIGIALGRIMSAKHYQVEFWDKEPSVLLELGGESKGLPGIVPEALALFLCVPSWALREALLYVSPYVSKQTVVVGLSKGIEASSLKFSDELLATLLPKKQPYCLLSGPMIAEELRAGGIGAGVIAANSPRAGNTVAEIFEGSPIIVSESDDQRGVALCGVLKNIYSLALGISRGLGLGENSRGVISVIALVEIKKILSLLGGKQETALGLAGLGDFIATGASADSKNQVAGREIAKGRISNLKTEGLMSLSSLVILLGEKRKKLPLLSALHNIVAGNIEAEKAFAKLLFPK